MKNIRNSFKKTNKSITTAFLALFILHFLSINGIANALEICYEQNGDINVESVADSFITIPAEDAIHADTLANHEESIFSPSQNNHSDISFTAVWLNEQKSSQFNPEHALKYLDGILNAAIAELPRSRVFKLASFIPPLIEDFITTNLQTVVLLN